MTINLLQKPKLIHQFITKVFPIVKKELHYWKLMAENIPDPVLSQQAIDSIEKKSFHCQGGSIYSLYMGTPNPNNIRFIVALQTISDYLDNLCDRVGVEDQNAFLQLHMAILNSLDPYGEIEDYYTYYPHNDDGGYLKSLVSTCREYLRALPSYSIVSEEIQYLGKLYSEMQSLKHIKLSERNRALEKWTGKYIKQYPEITTWEFPAAAGSTLGIFILCTLAEDRDLTRVKVKEIVNAYFPWVCGLHILLDYFIDEKEDIITQDLNFVSFYSSNTEKKERLLLFLSQSLNKISYLPNAFFHEMIIEGLLAMYLSDYKASSGLEKTIASILLNHSTNHTKVLFHICKILRKKKVIT